VPSGTQNLIGYGEAQVLPPSQSNPMQFVELYKQQQESAERQQRYNDVKKSQDEKELYGIVGDSLNPRNFNTAIHGRILQAQKELAQKIKSESPSYGDTFILAQNKAAELGKISQQLNNVDQQLALTKKEYEFDKRVNSGAIEMAARKRILDELNRTGQIDETINYFDEVANDNPELALVDKSGYTFTDFRPEERQPLEYDVKKRNSAGRVNQYKWKMDNFPAYYDVVQKGEGQPPEVLVRSEPSGILTKEGTDVPMLSQDAYRRFSLTPSNVFAINQRLKSQYGAGLNLRSEVADKLRRIEALKDVERNKPVPKESIVEQQPIPRVNVSVNAGGGKSAARTWDLSEFEDVPDKDNGNGKDITQPFSGFKVTAIGGDALLAKKVVFHPGTKKFTVTEYLSRDDKGNPTGEKTKTWSASSFRQIIENMNPGTDMKNFDALVERNVGGDVKSSNTERKEDEKPQEQKPKRWYERGGDIRVPKDVKNTKMTTKPSWAN